MQIEIALSYRRLRGLYFLAVVFATTIALLFLGTLMSGSEYLKRVKIIFAVKDSTAALRSLSLSVIGTVWGFNMKM